MPLFMLFYHHYHHYDALSNNLTQGGIYIFQLVDYYGSAISLMYIAFFECTAIVWLYGTKRLSSNVYDMTGSYPNWFFRFCWMFLSPLLIFAIWDDLE